MAANRGRWAAANDAKRIAPLGAMGYKSDIASHCFGGAAEFDSIAVEIDFMKEAISGDLSFVNIFGPAKPDNVVFRGRTEEAAGATHGLELAPHSFRIVTICDGPQEPPAAPRPEPPAARKGELILDGKLFGTVGVVDGGLVWDLPVPARDGWVLEGWYHEDGIKFDPSKPIEGDSALIVKLAKAPVPEDMGGGARGFGGAAGPKLLKKPQVGLPQTGDASPLHVAGGAAAGPLFAAMGLLNRRRRA